MAEIILSTEDLSVFGGPASLDVDVDFGPTGTRGSRIYGVSADPRLTTTVKPVDTQNFDIAMVVTPSEPDYLTVYQKIGTTADEWIEFASLVPNVYSSKSYITFTAGTGTINVPASDLFTLTTYTAEQFMVQIQIEDEAGTTKPTSLGVDLAITDVGAKKWLTITVTGAEFSSGTWSDIAGQRIAHVFISSTAEILDEVTL